MTEQKRRSHWPITILSTLSSVVNMLLPLVLVRVLTKDEAGIFRLFFLYLSYLPAVALTAGIMSGLGYWAGQENKREGALQGSSFLILCAALLASAIVYTFGGYFLADASLSGHILTLFAIAAFGSIAAPFFEEAAISTGKIWTGALFYAGFEIVRTLCILTTLLIFRNVEAVFLAHASLICAKAVLGYLYGYRLGFVTLFPRVSALKDVVSYALPVSCAWAFGMFVTADQLVLSRIITPAELALYGYSCLQIQPLFMYEHSVMRVLIPQLSEGFSKNNYTRSAELYKEGIAHLALIIIPAVVGLIVFAKPIIEILLTKEYLAGAPYLRTFALSYLLMLFPYDAVARAKGKSRWILSNFILFSGVSLTLTFTGAILIGPLGALMAVLVSGSLLRLNAVRFVQRETHWNLTDFIPFQVILRNAGVCAVLAILSFVASPLFESRKAWFLVCGPIFALLYFVAILFLKSREISKGNSKKVVIISQSLRIGGLEKMILQLAKQLKERGSYEVAVYAYDHDEGGESLVPLFQEAGIPVELFKKKRGFSLKVVLRLLHFVQEENVSILHCHDIGGLMYCVAAKVLSFGRPEVVMTQHSFIHLQKNRRYALYEKFFTSFADVISAVSQETKETYVSLGFKEVHVVENGVDFLPEPPPVGERKRREREELVATLSDDTLREALSPRLDSIWVLYLARLYPGKGQEGALALWRMLPDETRRDATLLFVGPEAMPGVLSSLQSLREDSPSPKSILFMGGSKYPKRWMSVADVYLSCSESEGMPLGPLEAAGAGLPTVLSRIPGHLFLAQYSRQFNLDDPVAGAESLEASIKEIQRDEMQVKRQAWDAAERLRLSYSLEDMAKKFEELYSLPVK